VTARPLVFLDANILFSAAIGGQAFELLLDLARAGRVRLATSRACILEAERNLDRKRPDRRPVLAAVMTLVSVAAYENPEHSEWASALVDADDVHVLAATRAAGADVLLTGDVTHFGPLMERSDLGLQVRTVRAFLLEGPRFA
jgi:predicted nucleic acid-binding protein